VKKRQKSKNFQRHAEEEPSDKGWKNGYPENGPRGIVPKKGKNRKTQKRESRILKL